jgi:hypothetical protein
MSSASSENTCIRNTRPDGTSAWTLWQQRQCPFDGTGRSNGSLAMVMDVTDAQPATAYRAASSCRQGHPNALHRDAISLDAPIMSTT